MLPKRRRISRHVFPSDPRSGSVFHALHLSLRVTKGNGALAQVSVVVSKKVAPHATDRHLIKRRVYESVARTEKESPLPARAYVFFAKNNAHTIPYATLRDEVTTLLKDAIVKHTHLV